MRFYSPAAMLINQALNNVDEWGSTSAYTIAHIPTGITFWVRNGAPHFDVYLIKGSPATTKTLGYIERLFLYPKAKRIKKMLEKPVKKTETTNQTVTRIFLEKTLS